MAAQLISPVCAPNSCEVVSELTDTSLTAVKNGTMTLRDRDTTEQLIGKVDEVIAVVEALCNAEIDWVEASKRLEAYSGEQAT